MASEPADDAQVTRWASAAGRGDRRAAEAFIRATQHDVWRFLVHLVDSAHAEDLMQETYLRALRNAHLFTGRGHARSWLFTIARRVAADHIRAITSRPRLTSSADWEGHADRSQPAGLPGIADSISIKSAIRALRPERREAFVLTQVLGFGYAEAAEMCGCPIGTIRSRVARAREDLMRALSEDLAPRRSRQRRAASG